MPENLIVPGDDKAYHAGHDQINWNGGRFEGVKKEVAGPPEYTRCRKCSYKRLTIMKRCPVCKK